MSQIGTLTTTYQCKNCGQPVKVQRGNVFVDPQVADFLVTPCECRLRERLEERCVWFISELLFHTGCGTQFSKMEFMAGQSNCPFCGRKVFIGG
jgi:hypothetical protein